MQQLEPGIHHAQPLVVPGQVLALFAHHLAQPFPDFGVVHIVVIHPALVARIVGRVDVNTLHPALIPGQQGLERLQVVAPDDHVFAAVVRGGLAVFVEAVLALQHPEGDLLVVVYHFFFSNPFKGGHGFLPHMRRMLSASFWVSVLTVSNVEPFS